MTLEDFQTIVSDCNWNSDCITDFDEVLWNRAKAFVYARVGSTECIKDELNCAIVHYYMLSYNQAEDDIFSIENSTIDFMISNGLYSYVN